MTESLDSGALALREKLAMRSASIGIIGLGYVGLPLAITCVRNNFRVIGFDVDQLKVDALLERRSYIKHLPESQVSAMVDSGRFQATVDFTRLDEPDALLICVPTPLTDQREPDMRYVESTCRSIAKTLRPGQLVVLESTTYPGTTDELMRGILEESGLRCGKDFYLAFSPEREDPANPDFETATIPKVVGGVDEASGDVAEALYSQIIEKVVRVSSARAAEATKLTENIFRAVNIALVNELKTIFDRMDIDVWEVLDAAATKPFGFMRFTPGPGWGGHCIPIDPFYLSWKAREFGASAKFIELAGEINVQMPDYVVGKLQRGLNERRKSIKGSRILMLGIAYKRDVDDARESPAFVIMDRLLKLGAKLTVHDPHVQTMPRTRRWAHLTAVEAVDLTAETLSKQDAVMIVTDHSDVDYELVLEHAPLIIDTRGIYRAASDKVVKA
ncbi:MAG: nucleotide sugar dehydrogenase [bacterium]